MSDAWQAIEDDHALRRSRWRSMLSIRNGTRNRRLALACIHMALMMWGSGEPRGRTVFVIEGGAS